MPYTQTDWSTSDLTAGNLSHAETQYEEAVQDAPDIRTATDIETYLEVSSTLPNYGNEGRLIYVDGVIYIDNGDEWFTVAEVA